MTVGTNAVAKGNALDRNRFMTDDPQFPHYVQDPKNFPSYKFGLGPGLKIAHPAQSKPMIKLMTQAFKGKLKKGLFYHPKHKKARVL